MGKLAIFQIRYIITGFRIRKIPDKDKIWIDNKNILFQRNDKELSCLILTDDEKYESNLKHISENALTFIKLYGLIFNQGAVSHTWYFKTPIKKRNWQKACRKLHHLIRTLRYFSNDSVEQVKPLFDQVNNCIQKFKSLEVALDYWALAKEQQFKTGKDEPIQFLNAMISLESLLGESDPNRIQNFY